MHQVGGALDKQSQKCFLFFSWRHWGHTLTFAIPISISKASRSNRGKENVILVAPIHTWIGISPITQFRRYRLWKKEKNIEKKRNPPFPFMWEAVCAMSRIWACAMSCNLSEVEVTREIPTRLRKKKGTTRVFPKHFIKCEKLFLGGRWLSSRICVKQHDKQPCRPHHFKRVFPSPISWRRH